MRKQVMMNINIGLPMLPFGNILLVEEISVIFKIDEGNEMNLVETF